jgi:zinc transport system ATP-binding protein
MTFSHDLTNNIIEVKDVSFAYDKTEILSDINLNVHKGDYLGLIGPNGGGKTTLVKIMLGLLAPDKGSVDIKSQNIAYVGQKATNIDQKFPVTVSDVVSMGRYASRGLFRGLSKHDKKVVLEALEQVGIADLKDKLIGNLSGGQQQRTFIARALAQKAEIIFLDEPTSGVDIEAQTEFYKILKQLNQDSGITLIIISHDVDVISKEVTEIAAINRKLVFYGLSKEFIKEEKGIKFVSRNETHQHGHPNHD